MNSKTFVHLRVQSSYSLLASTVQVSALVSKCVKSSMPAVALTDNGNMFAALEFSMEATKYGLQPIVGGIFNFDSEIEDDEPMAGVGNLSQILLIAKNKVGYANLLKLTSAYNLSEEPEDKRCISFSELKKHSEGLILLTCGIYGTVGRLLLRGKKLKAEKFLVALNRVFSDNLYIELMRHGIPEESQIEQTLIDLGLKHHIPFVATNNVYFVNAGMHKAHEVLWCIADGKYIYDEARRKSNANYYLKSADEMHKLFADIPEALDNTLVIAKRCSVKAEEGKVAFPQYDVKFGKDDVEELKILSEEGFKNRISILNKLDPLPSEEEIAREQKYRDRLNYELEMIIKMDFPSYFLIVSDFIRWSKKNDIPVGPGRGSGAGSIVSWCLDITDVDPIKFGLFFERFLNPERVSLPDLDIDFCQERRDEVIQYVRNKYGSQRVAHIITFGKLQARAVIRDVGRVLQLSYGQVDRIAKMVPFNAVNPVTLSQAIEMEPQLRQAQEEDENIATLLDISLRLEGLHRHASIHAAGIVISRTDLEEVVPLYKSNKSDLLVIQYSMKYAEAAGLVKFDFLGLKTLTVISNCQKLIRKNCNPDFDINQVHIDDQKTFDMLSQGNAIGVFQFESTGIRAYLSQMKPDSIEDIIALGALYRPGPMDNIPDYISRKHGLSAPDYLHEKLESVLKRTFGVIIYQEQVQEIAQVLAGYSLGAADLLRRAMGKKIKAEMDAQRAIFVQGATANGVSMDQATYVFDLVAKFAGYGFNRAHAVAYGMVSYHTAYLKANYTTEMLTSILNTEIHDTDKVSVFTQEAKNFGINVVAPNINLSESHFSIKTVGGKKSIVYGLGAIKNVSFAAMEDICNERNTNGEYTSIFDFVTRVNAKVINKRQLEYLIKSGAFDSIAPNRKQLFESIDTLNHYFSTQHAGEVQQISLFANTKLLMPELAPVTDWSYKEKLGFEADAIGFYLSDHPLNVYKKYFKYANIYDAYRLRHEVGQGSCELKIAAIPTVVKIRSSPKGRYMFVAMSTATGPVNVAIFDEKVIDNNRDLIYAKTPTIVEVDVRKEGDIERVIVKNMFSLDDYFKQYKTKVLLDIGDGVSSDTINNMLKDTGYDHSISTELTLDVKQNNKKVRIELPTDKKIDILYLLDNSLVEGVSVKNFNIQKV